MKKKYIIIDILKPFTNKGLLKEKLRLFLNIFTTAFFPFASSEKTSQITVQNINLPQPHVLYSRLYHIIPFYLLHKLAIMEKVTFMLLL